MEAALAQQALVIQSCHSGQESDMSLTTRLDKIEAALRRRDNGDPSDEP
jgi:hypothetical protein